MSDLELEAVLLFLNGCRKELKKKPLKNIPRGRTRDDWCPVSQALGFIADNSAIDVKDEKKAETLAKIMDTHVDEYEHSVVYLHSLLQKFISEFYAGMIPELLKK